LTDVHDLSNGNLKQGFNRGKCRLPIQHADADNQRSYSGPAQTLSAFKASPHACIDLHRHPLALRFALRYLPPFAAPALRFLLNYPAPDWARRLRNEHARTVFRFVTPLH
jgi:hypothetical protein